LESRHDVTREPPVAGAPDGAMNDKLGRERVRPAQADRPPGLSALRGPDSFRWSRGIHTRATVSPP